MINNFKETVSMDCSKASVEEFESIVETLEEIGYKWDDFYSVKANFNDGEYTLVNNFGNVNHKPGSLGMINGERPIHINTFNKELFLALCHMNDSEDWVVGECLVHIDSGNAFKVKELSGANYWNGMAGNIHKATYRKATVEEIMKHFGECKKDINKKQNTMEERFPFTLSETDAKKIIDVACNGWKRILSKEWGSELLLKGSVEITQTRYKEMREACTEPQNELFDTIFGKDEVEKPYEPKVGDWVVVQGQVVKIEEISDGWIGSSMFKHPYMNGDCSRYNTHSPGDIRLATEYEISEALPNGKACLVSDFGDQWTLRYSDGKGGFFLYGRKSGNSNTWGRIFPLDVNAPNVKIN